MNIRKIYCLPFFSLGMLAAVSGQGFPSDSSAELSYFGRASVKIKTVSGFVIYIDPYSPGDYHEPADLVLVTHGHGDHNKVSLITKKPGTIVAAPAGAVPGSGVRVVAEGEDFSVGPVRVHVMPAANKNHDRKSNRGYMISFDGLTIYHAGDTSFLPEMTGYVQYGISYALLPCDGFYNMGAEEASRCAEAMQAKRVLPIHSSKDTPFNQENAAAVRGREVIVLRPGEILGLEK